MTKRSKWVVLTVLFVVILVMVGVFIKKGSNQSTVVREEKVAKRDLIASVTASGQVQPHVKVDVEVLDTLSFAVGMFRVAPGATIHFEQIHVNGELWLPSMVLVRADARLALLKKLRAEVEIRYSDYKKFQSESRIESVMEQ